MPTSSSAAPTRPSTIWSVGSCSAPAGRHPQAVLTVPLLVGTDGVGEDGQVAGQLHRHRRPGRRAVRQADEHPGHGWSACTPGCAPPCIRDEVDAHRSGRSRPAAARRTPAKRRVAREIVALYHGADAATAAEERFDAVFKRGAHAGRRARACAAGRRPGAPAAVLVAAGLAASHQRGAPADRRRGGPGRRQAGSGRGVRPASGRPGRLGR